MRKIDTSKAHYVGLDQRIAPRSDVYCRLPFVLPDGRQEMCTCVNISADGLLMRYERGLEPGDLVVYRMPIIGRVAAKVIWSLGGKAGVEILEGSVGPTGRRAGQTRDRSRAVHGDARYGRDRGDRRLPLGRRELCGGLTRARAAQAPLP